MALKRVHFPLIVGQQWQHGDPSGAALMGHDSHYHPQTHPHTHMHTRTHTHTPTRTYTLA